MKKLAIAAACLGIVTVATTAFAGGKWSYPVTIYDGGTWKWVGGALGSARNSADAVQYIGCEIDADASNAYAMCWAMSPDGQYVTCYNVLSGGMREAISAMTPGSYVSFQMSEEDWTKCSLIQVSNGSQFEPPQL